MVSRFLLILWFHFKVILVKVIVVGAFVMIAFVRYPFWIVRRQASLPDLLIIFNPYEWNEALETNVESYIGCRWYIVGTNKRPQGLPKYSFWMPDEKWISCLFLDDAVQLNLIHGGTLTKRPYKMRKLQNGFAK